MSKHHTPQSRQHATTIDQKMINLAQRSALGNTLPYSRPHSADEAPQHHESQQVSIEIDPLRNFSKIRDLQRERTILRAAQKFITSQGSNDLMEHPQDWHKTGICGYAFKQYASVRSGQHKATFGNVAQCNNVFICPTCSARINAYRRQEISQATAKARSQGINPIMVTFTFPHRRDISKDKQHQLQPLEGQLDKLSKAARIFKSGRSWQQLKSDIGLHGTIKALEITYSPANGWHPHHHELWFCRNDIDAEQLRQTISNLWLKAVRQAGIPVHSTRDFHARAIDITHNVVIDDYLAKDQQPNDATLSHELAGHTTKRGRHQSFSPMYDFLSHKYFRMDDPENYWHQRYLEYITATRGKHALRWSNGLKQWAGLNEIADDEVPEQSDLRTIGWLPSTIYRDLRKSEKDTDLLIAALDGYQSVVKWLRQQGIDPGQFIPGENEPGRPAPLTTCERRELKRLTREKQENEVDNNRIKLDADRKRLNREKSAYESADSRELRSRLSDCWQPTGKSTALVTDVPRYVPQSKKGDES